MEPLRPLFWAIVAAMRTAADVRREKEAQRAAGMSAAGVNRSLKAKRAERKARLMEERKAIAAFQAAYSAKTKQERNVALSGATDEACREEWLRRGITSQ